MDKTNDINTPPCLNKLTAGRQHQARARVEAEAFEAALLEQCPGPIEQGLARTAATFYFAVRTYHWRRMARARRRDKELSEAVAAGNALERLLDRLQLLPAKADDTPTPQLSPRARYEVFRQSLLESPTLQIPANDSSAQAADAGKIPSGAKNAPESSHQ